MFGAHLSLRGARAACPSCSIRSLSSADSGNYLFMDSTGKLANFSICDGYAAKLFSDCDELEGARRLILLLSQASAVTL